MIWRAWDEETLKRLSYHGLWGLQLDVPDCPSLYDFAQSLHNDEGLRQQMIEEVQALASLTGVYGRVIRFFCWVFNWNNYRSNCYHLCAYYSWRLYEEGLNRLPTEENTVNDNLAVATTAARLATLLTGLIDPLFRCSLQAQVVINELFHFFRQEIDALMGNGDHALDIDLSPDVNQANTHFRVTRAMLEPLSCLGLSAEIDGLLAYSELSKAYKKSCLETHPDKPTGSHEAFVRIQTAYDSLKTLIEGVNDPLGLRAFTTAYFEQLNREREEVLAAFKQHISNLDQYIQNRDQHINNVDRYIDESKQYIDESKQYIDESKQYIDEAKEYVKRVEDLQKMIEEEKEESQKDRKILRDLERGIQLLIDNRKKTSGEALSDDDQSDRSVNDDEFIEDGSEQDDLESRSDQDGSWVSHNPHCLFSSDDKKQLVIEMESIESKEISVRSTAFK
jgi:hypothetical protein